jgi:hypothetical protein
VVELFGCEILAIQHDIGIVWRFSLQRKDAAKELLPYFHPKLASVEARTSVISHEDRLEQLRQILAEDDD